MAPRLTVLGIETSCDETAAAVVDLEDGRLRVRSSAVGSQVDVHARYGGVVPELASRAHLERLLPVIGAALTGAETRLDAVDAIAVGTRPGLIGSLLVGTSAAKALAWALEKPFIGVDHVAAHLVAALLDAEPIPFPALGLVVSGGHTSLFVMRDALAIESLLRTPDDAVGEAFDKGATVLGLPYPGGPEVERLAHSGRAGAVRFPVPKLDFSFSGLKTALLYEVRGVPAAPGRPSPPPPPEMTEERRRDLAASYQHALVQAVVRGVERAWVHAFEGERGAARGARPRALVVGGGVAANQTLRDALEHVARGRAIELRVAPQRYCLDNAAMIAGLGALRAAAGEKDALDLAAQPHSSLR